MSFWNENRSRRSADLVNIDDSTSNDPDDAVAPRQEEQNSVDVKGKLTKAAWFQVPKISLKG